MIANTTATSTTTTRGAYLAAACLLGLVALVSADHPRYASRREARDDVVVGRFRAPAPERIMRFRLPQGSDFGSQVIGASFRVADSGDLKVVNGIGGASLAGAESQLLGRRQGAQTQTGAKPRERQVSAVMRVSDEGLNYPPSKLSADIHGNVAEIVTAPPEAVDSDVFQPEPSRLFGRGQ